MPPKKNLLARRNFSEDEKLSSAFVKTSAGQVGAAPSPFRPPTGGFAGGLPCLRRQARRHRRRNAFGLIQEYCTSKSHKNNRDCLVVFIYPQKISTKSEPRAIIKLQCKLVLQKLVHKCVKINKKQKS